MTRPGAFGADILPGGTMQTYGLQFDTTALLPFTPSLQLLYVNGRYAAPVHYGRGRVYIDVTGADPGGAFWLDVERYDAVPSDAGRWLDERRRLTGQQGGIYCSRDSLPAVELAAGSRAHMLGVATLDGSLEIEPPPGVGVLAFIQAYPASMFGMHADISVVTDRDYWAARAIGA